MAAVRGFVQPVSKTYACSVLGLTGYYKRFIEEYAGYSITLTAAAWKPAPATIQWSPKMQDEFCDSLCCIPSLTIPTQEDTVLLQTDTSMQGIRTVLSVNHDGLEKPVAFFSRKLLLREQWYAAIELEELAIVDSIIIVRSTWLDVISQLRLMAKPYPSF